MQRALTFLGIFDFISAGWSDLNLNDFNTIVSYLIKTVSQQRESLVCNQISF